MIHFHYVQTYLRETAPLSLELEAQLAASNSGQIQELPRAFNKNHWPDQQAAAPILSGGRLVLLEDDRFFIQNGVDQENLNLQLLFWRRDYEKRHGTPLAAQVLLEAVGREID